MFLNIIIAQKEKKTQGSSRKEIYFSLVSRRKKNKRRSEAPEAFGWWHSKVAGKAEAQGIGHL